MSLCKVENNKGYIMWTVFKVNKLVTLHKEMFIK